MRSKFNFFRRSNFWSWGQNCVCSWGWICPIILIRRSTLQSWGQNCLIMLFRIWSHDRICDLQINHEIETQNKALLGNFDLMKKGWSGDRIIIRNFDLMKNGKKFDLMNLTSWKNEFQSHEIRPPDHSPFETELIFLEII
jgi:hypothetical protein